MIRSSYFLVADRFPNEKYLRQWHIDKKNKTLARERLEILNP
jgi:hypothetical protein